MTPSARDITFSDADQTARAARRLGATLGSGDCLLLSGSIGAGKTHFARALIQSLQDHPEDVPSPTFTLIQTYETTGGEIWHADLYRLSTAQEIEELGLADAFETAICIVEWPDRLGSSAPQNALSITFQAIPANESARRLSMTWSDQKWTDRLGVMAID